MRVATLVFLLSLIASATAVLGLSKHSYANQDRLSISSPASRTFLAGTDDLGRDRAVRISAALVLGLVGACSASLLASALSLLLGGSAAFCPTWVKSFVLYAGDLFLTLPWIFLLMLIRAALPLSLPPLQSGTVTFLLLAILGVPAFLRMTCKRATRLKAEAWLLQCRAGGLRWTQILRHLLPHVRPLFWTQFLLYVPLCLVAEANLGTLGLGIAEPLPSWGNMLAGLQSTALLNSSRLTYLPLAMLVLVLAALELTIFGADREA